MAINGMPISFGSYNFPDTIDEFQSNFGNVVPTTVRLPGMDGGFDEDGLDKSPTELGSVQVAFYLKDSDLDTLRDAANLMVNWGYQKLVYQPSDGVSDTRFCWAKIQHVMMPRTRAQYSDVIQKVKLYFLVPDPHWYAGGYPGTALDDGYDLADGLSLSSGSLVTHCRGLETTFTVTHNGNATVLAAWDLEPHQITITEDLISWWELEENSGDRVDAHGSNDLSEIGTPFAAVGKINNALRVVAADSEGVQIANNSTLQTGNIDFTLAMWVYPTALSIGVANVIASRWTAAGNEQEWMIQKGGADKAIFTVSSNGSDNYSVTSSLTMTVNTWHYIIAWYDKEQQQIGISVNGTEDTLAHTAGVYAADTPLYLSGRPGTTLWWDGRIDEAAFWKRSLLSAERTWLYNSGSGRAYSDLAGKAVDTSSIVQNPRVGRINASGAAVDEVAWTGTLSYGEYLHADGKLGRLLKNTTPAWGNATYKHPDLLRLEPGENTIRVKMNHTTDWGHFNLRYQDGYR